MGVNVKCGYGSVIWMWIWMYQTLKSELKAIQCVVYSTLRVELHYLKKQEGRQKYAEVSDPAKKRERNARKMHACT